MNKREQIRISVRELIGFLLREGDIDNRHRKAPEDAMQEGSRIHRMIQKRMGPEYRAEVSLKRTYDKGEYDLSIEGRADGVVDRGQGTDREILIDEIKGTYRDLNKIKSPDSLHVAQAKCYAYMYGRESGIQWIQIRLTYCHMETEEIKYFHETFFMAELESWFENLVEEYGRWSDFMWEWKKKRRKSIENLSFPFPYRKGQKDLAAFVYRTIYHKRKLFLEAPTGVGKTLSTLFPALQALGQGMGDVIFYLTAKTIARTVAEETLELLRDRGLAFRSVTLTAKEKICPQEKVSCNPDDCPYAKGHYNRIRDALFALWTGEEAIGRSAIESYAATYRVCPFELSLDVSLLADGVIGDYNYLFDPHAALKRFFGESAKGEYLFLIDEAHNLLERGREMYSAVLVKEEIMELRREIKKELEDSIENRSHKENKVPSKGNKRGSLFLSKGYGSRLEKQLEKCNKAMLSLKKQCNGWTYVEEIDGVVRSLQRLHTSLGEYLEEQDSLRPDMRDALLDFYFMASHFLDIYERQDENYVKYTQEGEEGFILKLYCVNPSNNLRECMNRGRSSILFSATFLPIQYYKSLLGGEEQDYEVYAQSVFDPGKRGIFMASDVTSKYTRRSEEEYKRIASYIEGVVKQRHGNYMVFCPSYGFLKEIYRIYTEKYESAERVCVIQGNRMSEAEREQFLAHFTREDREERMLIGFCVLGGVFGEGIDLKRESLIGAIIVGTGLPQVCTEREIIKRHFDGEGESGFDYSYRFPGMNKVMQAAGRVIRTMDDIGIVVMLDERFLEYSYRRLLPLDWQGYEQVTLDTIEKRVERFWDNWL